MLGASGLSRVCTGQDSIAPLMHACLQGMASLCSQASQKRLVLNSQRLASDLVGLRQAHLCQKQKQVLRSRGLSPAELPAIGHPRPAQIPQHLPLSDCPASPPSCRFDCCPFVPQMAGSKICRVLQAVGSSEQPTDLLCQILMKAPDACAPKSVADEHCPVLAVQRPKV